MTRAGLTRAIKAKVKRAKPVVKKEFYKLLRRSTKPELERILRKVRVSRDGYDVSLG